MDSLLNYCRAVEDSIKSGLIWKGGELREQRQKNVKKIKNLCNILCIYSLRDVYKNLKFTFRNSYTLFCKKNNINIITVTFTRIRIKEIIIIDLD